MRYYKMIEDSIIVGIGSGMGGEEITQEAYRAILQIILAKPEAPAGQELVLTAALQWDSRPLPPEEDDEELTDAQALEIITGGDGL